jgi:nucleoside-diphosphate-sugar epimerase
VKYLNILLTGGAGRLGYHVSKLCFEEGYKVRAFDLPNVNWSHLRSLPNIEIQKGDITDLKSVEKACRDIDIIVHLAALLPPKSEVNKERTMKINVQGTTNLLKSKEHLTPIIFASSISTYGITSNELSPLKESHKQHPHNIYSESKIIAEKTIIEEDITYKILRVAPIAVAEILELPEVVPYRANQHVEFIYVKDAARAIKNCMERTQDYNEIYNIAGGISWQMTGKEYIDSFYDALGVEVEANYPEEYTAVDWYDTEKSKCLDYQQTSFNQFIEKLVSLGEEMGLR